MQRKSQPIPIKWYLASLIGALCLALVLMTTFEILGRGNPKVVSKLNGLSLDDDHVVSSAQSDETITKAHPSELLPHVDPNSDSNEENAPPSKPVTDQKQEKARPSKSQPATSYPQKPSQPQPATVDPQNLKPQNPSEQQISRDSQPPEPSLWSLLVSPAMLFAAATIVVIGSAVLIRNAILTRRQLIG